MGRWARSKQLAGASWRVLSQDKELMFLPLISGIASLAIAATFLVPIGLTSRTTDAAGATTIAPNVVSYVGLFLMYLVLAYVAVFFKTALLCGADERMKGGSPSLGSALSGATARAGKILPWAIVTATVSIILRSLEDRAGILGRLVIGLVGMAWAVVTFLVLPIVVFEDVGVGTAIKRSALLLKTTWGENLIVNLGIGLIAFVLSIPGLLVIGLGIASGSVPVIVGAVALGAVWLIAVSCWSTAMTAVFQLALYRYATQAPLPQEFAQVPLADAFGQKGAKRSFGFGS
ncbi:DUF6159 family protein [Aquihabitans sp. McL0605]|uniref:DUF6159 family protein n=1 Tax=Aquihabitans sp. McL0605 TaxID=3415671 RepID=UPI003CF9E1C1